VNRFQGLAEHARRVFVMGSFVRWLWPCALVVAVGWFFFPGIGAPTKANAIGKASHIQLARLSFRGSSDLRPNAMKRLLLEILKRTSIRPNRAIKSLKVQDADLFLYPFLYIQGDQGFAPWPQKDILRLRRHLTAGGTLFIDMSNGVPGGKFDQSVRRLSRRLFPQYKMAKLGQDHTLYKSFYLLRRFGGRVLLRPYIEGVTRGDRTPIVYSMNDHSGAWERDNFGNWTHAVIPGGNSQREHSFRFGINLLMYALCVNYKQDGVHAEAIMNRRK